MEANYVVIKVKYGDMLRRFNARVVDDDLDIHIDGLRQKIISLFSFPLDAVLMLTYIDEDGDIVTLGDDDDLHDVVKQALNPLRITVKLIEEKNSEQKKHPIGSSSPRELNQIQQPQQNVNCDVLKCLSNVPEPVRETFLKHAADLASKASSTSPVITQIAELFSSVCSFYFSQLSVIQPEKHSTTEAGVSESSKTSTKTNDLVDSDLATDMKALLKIASKGQQANNTQRVEKLNSEDNVETNEVKLDMPGGKSEPLPSKAFNSAVAAALNSPDVYVSSKGSTLAHPKANFVSGVGKKGKLQKEKARRIFGSYMSRRKHHLVPNHVPRSNKHCCVEKFDENPLLTYNLPAGLCGMAIEEETKDMPVDPKLAPIPDNGSVFDPPSRGYLGGCVKSPMPFQTSDTVGPVIPEFSPGPVAKNDPSFAASSVQTVSAISPHLVSEPLSFARSARRRSGIHLGVDCDRCGLYPITGPKFKSKVKVDCYLCEVCFQEIGNQTDYMRFDGSVASSYQMCESFIPLGKGSSTLPNACMGSKVKQAESKIDSRFVQDINISDGTTMPPLVAFTKIWRLRNNGTVVWPQKTQLVWVGGDKLSNVLSFEVNVPATGLVKDQELDVAVDLISPELPGRYISYWRLASPSGQRFGQRVWVLIQVHTPMEKMPLEAEEGFNLNLPPISSYPTTTNPEFIKLESNISKKAEERAEAALQQKIGRIFNFPMIDGASKLRPPSASSVSKPIVNLSHLTPPSPPRPLYAAPSDNSHALLPHIQTGTTQFDALEMETAVVSAEDSLLRQLMEMGFKNVALNREVVKLSGYNLAKSVHILTGYDYGYGFPWLRNEENSS